MVIKGFHISRLILSAAFKVHSFTPLLLIEKLKWSVSVRFSVWFKPRKNSPEGQWLAYRISWRTLEWGFGQPTQAKGQNQATEQTRWGHRLSWPRPRLVPQTALAGRRDWALPLFLLLLLPQKHWFSRNQRMYLLEGPYLEAGTGG